jgi:hypothetical protein
LVTTAKHLLTGLLVSVTLAAPGSGRTVRDEELNFEVTLPKELDWERRTVKPESDWKAHFETYDADAREAWRADVQLLVRRSKPKASLKEEAQGLRPRLEQALLKTSSRRTTEAKLNGEPCLVVDVVGEGAATRFHLTWRIARCGPWLYVLFARRTNKAIGDAVLEKEIARILGTFRFLRPAAPPPAKPPPAEPAAPAPRKAYRLAHWRLDCVKPAGLREVPPEPLDKANGVILRFEGQAEQSRCLVRIYARLQKSSRRVSLDKLARSKIERFEKADARRRDPVTARWKPPLARKGIRLELIALRLTPQVTRWYLADCRNDRQYEIEVITTGQAWEAHVAELLAEFRPRRRQP